MVLNICRENIYNCRVTSKKAIQRYMLKNTKDKLKWNLKKCSDNPHKESMKKRKKEEAKNRRNKQEIKIK